MARANNQREMIFNGESRQYDSSDSERFLEDICQSFKTNLLPAIIAPGGKFLTRLSNPLDFNSSKEDIRILQMQYTRFSPLYCQGIEEIYSKNKKQEIDKNVDITNRITKLWEDILNQHEPWDNFEELTNQKYIKNLNLSRWKEEIYFAIYSFKNKMKKVEPFNIFDKETKLEEEWPCIHITYNVEPRFIVDKDEIQHKKDYINFKLPTNELSYELSSDISRETRNEVIEGVLMNALYF